MARFGVLLLALALFCLASSSVATTSSDCSKTCLPPYTKLQPTPACLKMCHVCVNATSKGCKSYFIPYFYGNEYSKHFACWENCPMPTWAWVAIALSCVAVLLMICCAVWCCARRRKQNREAAIQMYEQQQMMLEQQQKRGYSQRRGSSAHYGPAPVHQPAPEPAPPPAPVQPQRPAYPQSFPPPYPPAAPVMAVPSRTVPRQDGGGWGVRTHPAYARLEEQDAVLNPYSTERR